MVNSKIALGLFHFNPHWNADSRSAHRHCTESLGPLLQAVRDNSRWRLSLEMSGSGLEFVHAAYPGLFRKLKTLVESGQIELISSLYTPSLWVAYPRLDLVNSVILNIDCLDRLGLPWQRIFFAQEALFGPGVAQLGEYFDMAICKDDYINHFRGDFDFSNPACTYSGMKIVVASNHLVNEVTQFLESAAGKLSRKTLTGAHHRFLERMSSLNRPGKFPAASGSWGGISWHWYHCGDGNHFGSNHKPDDLENCYFDPAWSGVCADVLDHLGYSGYAFTTIHEFTQILDYSDAVELPHLPEGSWNSEDSGGVRRWMGVLSTPAENDNQVLTAIARSRERLNLLGKTLDHAPEALDRYRDLWKILLHAQISDCLGWEASSTAVGYGLTAAEQVFVGANRFLDGLAGFSLGSPGTVPQRHGDLPTGAEPPGVILFGAEVTKSTYTQASPRSWVLDCYLESSGGDFGVEFKLSCLAPRYCPSGLEEFPATLELARLKPNSISLPLANGFIELEPGVYLIKDTRSVHVAAVILQQRNTIRFEICGAAGKHKCFWRFFVVRGEIQEALQLANQLNSSYFDTSLLLAGQSTRATAAEAPLTPKTL
jgi:hypothetical protein